MMDFKDNMTMLGYMVHEYDLRSLGNTIADAIITQNSEQYQCAESAYDKLSNNDKDYVDICIRKALTR